MNSIDQPPGHRKLPNDEKEKTLKKLKESKLKNLISCLFKSFKIINLKLKII